MEAVDRIFDTWLCILTSIHKFPPEYCKQSSVQIFNTYVRCHLSPPEGLRNFGSKPLTEEIAEVEEDDKVKFKDQLQIIGEIKKKKKQKP